MEMAPLSESDRPTSSQDLRPLPPPMVLLCLLRISNRIASSFVTKMSIPFIQEQLCHL